MEIPDLKDALGELAREANAYTPYSAAARSAELLRGQIAEGVLVSGTRLSEEAVSSALRISRNTLREAFALLSQEGLVVHALNRGVFVKDISSDDIRDLYAARRAMEIGAIRSLAMVETVDLRPLKAAYDEGCVAAEDGRWRDVGTASLQFHCGLIDAVGSVRLSSMMARTMAEFRLVYATVPDRSQWYKKYLSRHGRIIELLEAGDANGAERLMYTYLKDSEEDLLDSYLRAKKD